MTALLTEGARPAKGRPSPSSLAGQRRKLFWPFVGPALLFYTALFIVPVFATLWISFNEWPGAGPMDFVGLGNYIRILGDDLFLTSFVNTMLLLFVVGSGIFILAFTMSLFLRDMANKSFARSVIFVPHLINALVFGVLAGFVFNPDGLINSFLSAIGIDAGPEWLARDNLFPLIMITMLWATVGYFTTILMSGVDRIPAYFFEEAALAGANAWQRLRYVILPLTWDVFAVCAVLWTISAVKIFEIVWIFGGGTTVGSPPHETWTAAVYTYAVAFGGESIPSFGRAAAAAIVSLMLVTVLVVLLRRVTQRDVIEF